MSEFNEGDVVRLKSGGPPMTITEIDATGECYCRWFDGTKPMSDRFKPSSLKKDQGPSIGAVKEGRSRITGY